MSKSAFFDLIVIVIILAVASSPALSQGESGRPLLDKAILENNVQVGADGSAVDPEVLYLYTVLDGKRKQQIFLKEDLKNTHLVKVEGYVSGVVALCARDATVSIDGHTFSRIEKKGDGPLKLKDLGILALNEAPFSSMKVEQLLFEESVEEKGKIFLKGGYSLFPRVGGSPISHAGRFSITFETEGERSTIEIEQRWFDVCASNQTISKRGIAFRYIGTRMEKLRSEREDFESRLDAVAEGIRRVESEFGTELVAQVNIIDCEGILNAIALREGNEIWFYVDALLKEPLDELVTIAAHEALHKLVTKLGFTQSVEMRKLFAELKGYDLLSSERFMLVMTGSVPPGASSDATGSEDAFFAFIDERNFIDGMKGGHSGENIEEFCTSMLHSLMYPERLGQNLTKRLEFHSSPGELRSLTDREKATVINNFTRVVDCLIRALPQGAGGTARIVDEEAEKILERGLRKAQVIQSSFVLQNAH